MKVTSICTATAMVALALPAVASAKDRDHDHMPDRWEAKYGLNTHKNDARRDRDHDGLRNIDEYRAGTNPRREDSDRDGTDDRDERAGRVESFDAATGTLTITLFGGGSLTGKVNDATEIECDDVGDDNPTKVALRHGADDGPNHDQGDDHGGRGDDNRNCGTDALTAGKLVKEAEISGDGTSTIFEKVELAG